MFAVQIEQLQQHQVYDVCALIRGACSSGSPSRFFINQHAIQRPLSTTNTLPYNITRSPDLGTLSFCFSNITEDTVLIEYCYQAHLSGCPFCPLNLGEVEFLSRTEILQVLPESGNTNQDNNCEYIMNH